MIKHASLFSQRIALFVRQHFYRLAWRHHADIRMIMVQH